MFSERSPRLSIALARLVSLDFDTFPVGSKKCPLRMKS